MQNIGPLKLTVISRGTTNIRFFSLHTCWLSVVNKKAIINSSSKKFWANFSKFFAGYFFTFFFMELLTNYVEVIVPAFKSFNLVEIVLWLFIKNASKSKWNPGLQTVWNVNSDLLKSFFENFRCMPIHLYRLEHCQSLRNLIFRLLLMGTVSW